MDSNGNFNHDDDYAVATHSDDGVDTPIGVGSDERRMHVRAYNFWVSLLDGRAYPSIEDLEPEQMSDFSANSVLLDFTSGVENPAVAFLGAALRQECDLPTDVSSTDDIPSRSLLSRLTDHYLQIIANRAPIGFEAEFVNERGNNLMYRGILMPFSSDDDTIDFIYGVINWKEVADDALTAGIVDEVERALAANPPRQTAPIPVWADGPNAQTADIDANIYRVTPRADVLAVDDGNDEMLDANDYDGDNVSDCLAAARSAAQIARNADGRSRTALYRALSQAYDFSLAGDANPHDYAELLSDSGITAQERAPMTPVVKMVFGTDYDKTRLAEYGLALAHGKRIGLAQGAMFGFLESHAGGLKGVVVAERTRRRPAAKLPLDDDLQTRARLITPKGIIEISGDDEFIILVARRLDPDHVAVLGPVSYDEALVKKALRQLTHRSGT